MEYKNAVDKKKLEAKYKEHQNNKQSARNSKIKTGKCWGLKIPDIYLKFYEKIRISWHFPDILPIFLEFRISR